MKHPVPNTREARHLYIKEGPLLPELTRDAKK